MKYILVALLFFIFGCQSRCDQGDSPRKWMEPNGKLKVLSTTAMLHDLVKQIGGDEIDSTVLICGDLDPHTYQLVKGDGEKLAFADLIFYNGLGLEHGPSLQYYLGNSEKSIAIGEKIREGNPERVLNTHGQLDPHIWMDISLWKEGVAPIADALSKLDPKNQELYQQRALDLTSKMEKEHREIYALLHSIPASKRYFVTSHDAFQYFARAYFAEPEEMNDELWRARVNAPEGLAPESQISVNDIQGIIVYLEKYQVHVVFPETNVSKDSIRKIVSAGNEKGLSLTIADAPLYGDAMGKATYLEMIRHNAETIYKYLKQ